MDEFSDRNPFIHCMLQGLKLPRLFPSLLYLSWKFGHKKGKTKFYRGNTLNVDINESFQVEFPLKRNHSFSFTLFLKQISGELENIGNCFIHLPSISDISNGFHTSAAISTEFGDFVLSTFIKIQYVDKIDSDVQEMFEKTALLNYTSTYMHTIKKLTPLLKQNEDVSSIWGENGIFSESKRIEHSKFLETQSELIFDISPTVNSLASESVRCSLLLSDVICSLMEPVPKFITAKYVERATCETEEVYPFIALKMVEELNNENNDIDSTINTLMLCCTAMADLIALDSIMLEWLLYVASTSFFIVSYIEKKRLYKYDIAVSFDVLGRHALDLYVTRVIKEIHSCLNAPKIFADKIVRMQKSLHNLNIPEEVIQVMLKYIMDSVDFLVTRMWIMTENHDTEVLIGFNTAFPQFQFELINALLDIIHFSDELINGRIKVNALNSKMRGQWLKDVLQKLATMKDYPIEKIESIPLEDSPSPEPPDERRLNRELSAFEKILVKVPDKLPSPPKKILSTPPMLPKKR